MNETATPVKNRQTRYDLNFKRSAVELWQGSGKSAAAVAAELGISGQTLKTWKQPPCLPPPPSRAQIMAELQAENRRLRGDRHFALRQREILKKTLGILGSPSDNAAMESFWSSLKRELGHRCQFATRAEARSASFEWIEVFYNRERFHSSLGFHSPVDFETKLN